MLNARGWLIDCGHLKTNKLTVLCCRMSKLCKSFTVSVRHSKISLLRRLEAAVQAIGAGLEFKVASREWVKWPLQRGWGKQCPSLPCQERGEILMAHCARGQSSAQHSWWVLFLPKADREWIFCLSECWTCSLFALDFVLFECEWLFSAP